MGVSRLALALRTLVQLVQEHVANTTEIFAHLPIPHSKDFVSRGFEKPNSRLLAPQVRLQAMMDTVYFDDEIPFEADEINNVRANWMLPAEAKSAQSILAQLGPENALFLCGLSSQSAG